MRISSRGLIVAITLVVVGVAVAGAVGFVIAYQPGCAGCHLQGEFQTETAESTHGQVKCTACHGGTSVYARASFGMRQVFGMYVRVVPLDASVAYVESARCVECHAATMSQPARGSSGLKISHKDCAVGRSCTDCHSTVAHGSALPWPRTPTMELCFECHGANGAPAGCDECHVERIPSDRIQTSSFSVTHGSNARKTHGLGAMSSCDPCHGSTKCQPCHGAGVPHGKNFASKHSDSAVAEGARCTGCHVVSFCNGCHRLEMPHPPSFVKEHPAAAARDERICKRCHDPRDCTECHERHIHPVTIEQLRRLGLDIPKDGTE